MRRLKDLPILVVIISALATSSCATGVFLRLCSNIVETQKAVCYDQKEEKRYKIPNEEMQGFMCRHFEGLADYQLKCANGCVRDLPPQTLCEVKTQLGGLDCKLADGSQKVIGLKDLDSEKYVCMPEVDHNSFKRYCEAKCD